MAAFQAGGARIYAHLGRVEQAVDQLQHLVVPLERAPGWATTYAGMACNTASTLWLLGRTDYIEVIERNIREKVVAPDFRSPMQDGRLSLARLSALQGRYDEAVDWFAKSRVYSAKRAGRQGARARPLLYAAMAQFKLIGMTGWLRRAENFREQAAS